MEKSESKRSFISCCNSNDTNLLSIDRIILLENRVLFWEARALYFCRRGWGGCSRGHSVERAWSAEVQVEPPPHFFFWRCGSVLSLRGIICTLLNINIVCGRKDIWNIWRSQELCVTFLIAFLSLWAGHIRDAVLHIRERAVGARPRLEGVEESGHFSWNSWVRINPRGWTVKVWSCWQMKLEKYWCGWARRFKEKAPKWIGSRHSS